MLSNLHTHTVLCDGKNTPEEIVLTAIEKGFDSIGFSGHAPINFDQSWCIKDLPEYIATIQDLRNRYGSQVEIYLGVEEDLVSPVTNRSAFDYIIGSYHYVKHNGNYYPIDLSMDAFEDCMARFDGDAVKLAESYFQAFCEYIAVRKPDIVGHFDIITKYDERLASDFLNNPAYCDTANRFLLQALKNDCLFEVNTGAMARGYRTSPYPSLDLLHTLKKQNGKIILTSDCHCANALDHAFDDTKAMLRDIGFEYVYALSHGKFVKDYL